MSDNVKNQERVREMEIARRKARGTTAGKRAEAGRTPPGLVVERPEGPTTQPVAEEPVGNVDNNEE